MAPHDATVGPVDLLAEDEGDRNQVEAKDDAALLVSDALERLATTKQWTNM
jgi:predicted RecB family endonuclease